MTDAKAWSKEHEPLVLSEPRLPPTLPLVDSAVPDNVGQSAKCKSTIFIRVCLLHGQRMFKI